VKTTDLNNGIIKSTEEKISKIALAKTSLKILPKNTVFVAMYGGFNQIGRTGILSVEATCNQALSAIYPNENFNPYFVLTYLNHKVDDWKNFAASSRKDPNITKNDVLSFPIIYPTLTEQTKIAEFLSTVDNKISQLSRQLELLKQYKKGVMQKIFSQEIRFKNDNGEDFGEWGYLQLGELIEESKAVSKKQDEFDVLTSSRRGLIKQSEYFEGSRLIDRDNVGFNIIKPHEITYRSRSDDGLFYFNFNNLGITGIISTYYPVFSFKNSNNKFVTEYLNFNKADFSKYAVGTSQLVLSLNALRTVKLRIPSKPEQEKIAEFLTAIDERIYHTTAQLTQTKQWKKGLLQQMFV
jgi:type I restriction enzyme S subunit